MILISGYNVTNCWQSLEDLCHIIWHGEHSLVLESSDKILCIVVSGFTVFFFSFFHLFGPHGLWSYLSPWSLSLWGLNSLWQLVDHFLMMSWTWYKPWWQMSQHQGLCGWNKTLGMHVTVVPWTVYNEWKNGIYIRYCVMGYSSMCAHAHKNISMCYSGFLLVIRCSSSQRTFWSIWVNEPSMWMIPDTSIGIIASIVIKLTIRAAVGSGDILKMNIVVFLVAGLSCVKQKS